MVARESIASDLSQEFSDTNGDGIGALRDISRFLSEYAQNEQGTKMLPTIRVLFVRARKPA